MLLREIKKLDHQYFMRVFGERLPVCIDHAQDCYLFDTEGNQYTDFLSGIAVCCLGYSDEGFKSALKAQIDKLLHTSNYFYIEPQAKLSRLLCESTGVDRVFFANSGAEAAEGAIKLARKYFYEKLQHKYEIITMKGSFHGRTLTTLSATGQKMYHSPFKPLTPLFTHVPYNDVDAVKNAISDKTCAVMLEPILGEGGVIPAKAEFFKSVRALCDECGILMIADEVQTGMGRTGKFLRSMHFDVRPDIVILAKSLGNGIPIGAFLANEKTARAFLPGDHGSTFGGNPLATTAALYVTEKITSPGFMENIAETGKYFTEQLDSLAENKPSISGTRGAGLMLGLQLDAELDPKDISSKLLKKGFVTATAGNNTLRFLPPYIIRKKDIDALLCALFDLL